MNKIQPTKTPPSGGRGASLIECVPNFSEGNNMQIINQITDEIKSVDGVKLIDVDPGKATNRTVVTFVGEPNAVCEAAFRAVKKAAELIDMSKHHGEHPRFGATDVLPLIPIKNITFRTGYLGHYYKTNQNRLITIIASHQLMLGIAAESLSLGGNSVRKNQSWLKSAFY